MEQIIIGQYYQLKYPTKSMCYYAGDYSSFYLKRNHILLCIDYIKNPSNEPTTWYKFLVLNVSKVVIANSVQTEFSLVGK